MADAAVVGIVTFGEGRVAYKTLKSAEFKCEDLVKPDAVTVIPYPGIGPVGLRPGGVIKFIGKEAVRKLLEMHEVGAPIYVTGAKGIGKSCTLRAIAAALINQSEENEKIICIWDMEWALYNHMEALRNALLFAYCEDEAACRTIAQLTSVQEVCNFLSDRRHRSGEVFYFVIDRAESLDSKRSNGEERGDVEHRNQMKALLCRVVRLGRCCIYGVSPAATDIGDSSLQQSQYHMSLGFKDASYKAFMDQSVLGNLCPEWKEEVDIYGGNHPLFLSTLDEACRNYAARINPQPTRKRKLGGFPDAVKPPDNSETLECLRDREDWDAVLQLFMCSSSLSTIASDCASVVRRCSLSGVYNLSQMMQADRRYVLLDSQRRVKDYCTPYVKRLHIEGFREAERGSFNGGAWVPYCDYLLRNPTGINWNEMGWLCEHLFSEALTHCGGMVVDDIHIQGNIRVLPFSSPPNYAAWIGDIQNKVVDGIFFLPFQWNLHAVDGALAFRDSQGRLHFFALQATTNDKSHRRSVGEFMNLGVVEKWIAFEEKSSAWEPKDDWTLHFTFVCLNQSAPVSVDPVIKRLPSGKYYGMAGHTVHTVTFQDAFRHTFQDSLREKLEQLTRMREPLAPATGAAVATTVSVPKSLLEEILDYSTREKLETIAKDYGMDPAVHKKLKKAEFIEILAPFLHDKREVTGKDHGGSRGIGLESYGQEVIIHVSAEELCIW
ncbi:hypothetical protein SELMODRAFT_427892 [Selaginella moellendorffii]|uniref:Uncharacterized protein n=1 Tax=Selaginella moellendorffii TaxID=88036 RepID=D8T115_SELML|nr:hypothetical protein SELMODRAFT_427892 [Selaginella moellendorffii]